MKTILLFYSPDCIHCKEAKPKVRKILAGNSHLKYEEIDVTSRKGITMAQARDIEVIPTLILVTDGKEKEITIKDLMKL